MNCYHQSRASLTAASSHSSQFVSPPLPGHLLAENKRDRSNDADLKRDINVNSLILNTSNIVDDEQSLIATTDFHKHEPESVMMMMMSNDFNQNMFEDRLNRSNLTLLGGSIDDSNFIKTSNNKLTLLKKDKNIVTGSAAAAIAESEKRRELRSLK